MKTRAVKAALAGVVALTATLAAPAGPASAGPGDSDVLVLAPYNGQTMAVIRNGTVSYPAYLRSTNTFTGNFSSAVGSDVFLYTPGPDPDGIVHVKPTGTTATTSFKAVNVGGNYQALVGDFDGNAIDDVFWYAAGAPADALWLFKADGSHVSKAVNVGGTYRPTVINVDGDGYDDILWYAPGAAADAIWRFGSGGSHVNQSLAVGGDYQLIRGHFQNFAEGSPQDRLMFVSATGADSIWTFDYDGSHTSKPLPNITGQVRPIVGTFTDPILDSVLFYRPGAAAETFIGFTAGGAVQQFESPNVGGTYDVAVGDYDGNGYQDIAYNNQGNVTIWKFNGGGYSQSQVNTSTDDNLPFTAFRYPPI